MAFKNKNTSLESPALKRAVSQAVRENSYQIQGSWTRPTSVTPKDEKKVITLKK